MVLSNEFIFTSLTLISHGLSCHLVGGLESDVIFYKKLIFISFVYDEGHFPNYLGRYLLIMSSLIRLLAPRVF